MKLAARCDGFSREAGRHLHEKDRRGLEALLRYCLRPTLAQERLSWVSEEGGELVVRLKRPMADGQTTLRMRAASAQPRAPNPGLPTAPARRFPRPAPARLPERLADSAVRTSYEHPIESGRTARNPAQHAVQVAERIEAKPGDNRTPPGIDGIPGGA